MRSLSNVKDLIKDKLNQLSKEELVDALADVCAIYVTANITTQLSGANCIQQCINNVQTNLQQVDNVLTQRLNINLQETMTVKELKEALANVPDDAEVYKYVTEKSLIGVKRVNYEEDINIFEIY